MRGSHARGTHLVKRDRNSAFRKLPRRFTARESAACDDDRSFHAVAIIAGRREPSGGRIRYGDYGEGLPASRQLGAAPEQLCDARGLQPLRLPFGSAVTRFEFDRFSSMAAKTSATDFRLSRISAATSTPHAFLARQSGRLCDHAQLLPTRPTHRMLAAGIFRSRYVVSCSLLLDDRFIQETPRCPQYSKRGRKLLRIGCVARCLVIHSGLGLGCPAGQRGRVPCGS